jgi:hypothetical protein
MSFSLAQPFESLTSSWSVKNTFVHFDVSANEKSSSSKWKAKTDITSARDQSSLDYLISFLYGATTTRDLTSRLHELEEVSAGAEDQQNSFLPFGKIQDASADDENESHSGLTAPRVSFSVGAAGHYEGTCKPCAWNWKEGGCAKGSDCDFCHLCEEGAVKQRRRQKIAHLRSAEKAAKRAQKATLLCDDKDDSLLETKMES